MKARTGVSFLVFLLFLDASSLGLWAQQSTDSALRNLKDPNKKIRKEAAADLGVLGKKEAINVLMRLFIPKVTPTCGEKFCFLWARFATAPD